jgi:DNA polymerase
MDSAMQFWSDKAALDWQVELGADEALLDAPVNRYDVPTTLPKAAPVAVTPEAKSAANPNARPTDNRPPVPEIPSAPSAVDAVAKARVHATSAPDLAALRSAMEAFELCDLKRGARSMVFGHGPGDAPVMILTDAPNREEDRAGAAFIGAPGLLLDKMLSAIDLSRTEHCYIAPVLPWRPPQDRDPRPEEIAMMQPFLERHIALANPKLLILMGNQPCQMLLGRRGITRLRGTWSEAHSLPCLPMFPPAHLMRTPMAKRDAWADLLDLKSKLKALA